MTSRVAIAFAFVAALARPASAQTTTHHHTTQSSAAPPPAAASPAAPPPPPSSHPVDSGNPSVWTQPGRHNHEWELSVSGFVTVTQWGWANPGIAAGPAFRASIPLFGNGPLSGNNNDLRVTFGLMLFVFPYETSAVNVFFWISSPIALQYNMYFTRRWSVFIEAGVLIDYYPVPNMFNCYDHPTYYCDIVLFHPLAGIGARYHFNNASGFPAVSLRFEYPTGPEIGISF